MKLFLSSIAIDEKRKKYFTNLVGKSINDISFALIENAADLYPEDRKGFVLETRKKLESLGMNITLVDLKEYNDPDKLYDELSKYDVIWSGGGNVYYLRWLMRESGFDEVIKKLLSEGIVYGGGSAGAIVAGPTLKAFDSIDDPSAAPVIINEGLSLTNEVIIPHWGVDDIQNKLNEIEEYYKKTDYNFHTLSDEQTLLIDGNKVKVIP